MKRLLNSFFSYEVEKRPNFESLKDDEWLNEDQAMHNEVQDELNNRYEEMSQGDEKKTKLLVIKKELLEKESKNHLI